MASAGNSRRSRCLRTRNFWNASGPTSRVNRADGFIRVGEAAPVGGLFHSPGARAVERNVKPGVLVGMSRLSLAIIALSFALLIGALVLTVFTF